MLGESPTSSDKPFDAEDANQEEEYVDIVPQWDGLATIDTKNRWWTKGETADLFVKPDDLGLGLFFDLFKEQFIGLDL